MDSTTLQQIRELLGTRPDLSQVQISLYAGVSLSTVRKVARQHGLKRKQGDKKKITPAQALQPVAEDW